MSSESDWSEVQKVHNASLTDCVTLTANEQIYLPTVVYREMGEPEHVRCFTNGMKLGFTDEKHKNSYSVTNADTGGLFSVKWLAKHIGEMPEKGHYKFEYDEDDQMYIIDFSSGPIDD